MTPTRVTEPSCGRCSTARFPERMLVRRMLVRVLVLVLAGMPVPVLVLVLRMLARSAN